MTHRQETSGRHTGHGPLFPHSDGPPHTRRPPWSRMTRRRWRRRHRSGAEESGGQGCPERSPGRGQCRFDELGNGEGMRSSTNVGLVQKIQNQSPWAFNVAKRGCNALHRSNRFDPVTYPPVQCSPSKCARHSKKFRYKTSRRVTGWAGSRKLRTKSTIKCKNEPPLSPMTV